MTLANQIAVFPQAASPLYYNGARAPNVLIDNNWVLFGDSQTLQEYGEPYSNWKTDISFTSGSSFVIDMEGIGGQTTGQIADRVTNVDPTIVTPSAGLDRAEQVASWCRFEAGANDVTAGVGPSDVLNTVLAGYARAVGAFTSEYILIPPTGKFLSTTGTPLWAQETQIRRALADLYPNRVFWWGGYLNPEANRYFASDALDYLAGRRPTSSVSLPGGSVNTQHYGQKGNDIIAHMADLPTLAALSGVNCVVAPYREFHLTGSAAATAQTMGGAVCAIDMIGTPDTLEIAGGDNRNFTIDINGNITRATGTVLSVPFSRLIVRATKGPRQSIGQIKVWIGQPDLTTPATYYDGRAWAVTPNNNGGNESTGAAVAVTFWCGPGTDGLSMLLVGNEDNNVTFFERGTTNRMRLLLKDISGNNAVSISTAAAGATVTHASGWVTVFASADLLPTVPVGRMYVNEISNFANVNTLVQGASINWNNRMVLHARTTTGLNPFIGYVKSTLVLNQYVDWSDPAMRALYYDPITGEPKPASADGKFNGIQSLIWEIGNSADKLYGNSLGLPLVGAMPPNSSAF